MPRGRATRSTISAAARATSAASWPSAFPARRSSASIPPSRCWTRRAARPPTRASASPRATWRTSSPTRRPSILYSNAAYQWLPGHIDMFPGLMKLLPSGGQLAIQMPRNHEAPSHALMHQAAKSGPWASKLAGIGGICAGRGAGAVLRCAEAALVRSRSLGVDLSAGADRQGSGGAVHREHRPAAVPRGAGRARAHAVLRRPTPG